MVKLLKQVSKIDIFLEKLLLSENPACRAHGLVFFWYWDVFLVFDRKPLLLWTCYYQKLGRTVVWKFPPTKMRRESSVLVKQQAVRPEQAISLWIMCSVVWLYYSRYLMKLGLYFILYTAWKVFKYGVISGPYFPDLWSKSLYSVRLQENTDQN